MSVKSYRMPFTHIADGTDIKDDLPHTISRDLVRRIQRRNRNAVKVDPRKLYFFQKLQSGRRCSCWDAETSPEGHCPVCYTQGFAGGFTKWGCQDHVIDWTHPRMTAVGVVPNFVNGKDTRPTMFELPSGVTSGYIETEVDIQPNVRVLDAMRSVFDLNNTNNDVSVKLKTPTDFEWINFERGNVAPRLHSRQFLIRVEFQRPSTAIATPTFCCLHFRYRVRSDVIVVADEPRITDSRTLAEFGIFDSFTTATFWLPDMIKNVSTSDFFRKVEDGTNWKAFEDQPNKPLGYVTSNDVTCRLVQAYEAYALVP
jgi:hypothetical protein